MHRCFSSLKYRYNSIVPIEKIVGYLPTIRRIYQLPLTMALTLRQSIDAALVEPVAEAAVEMIKRNILKITNELKPEQVFITLFAARDSVFDYVKYPWDVYLYNMLRPDTDGKFFMYAVPNDIKLFYHRPMGSHTREEMTVWSNYVKYVLGKIAAYARDSYTHDERGGEGLYYADHEAQGYFQQHGIDTIRWIPNYRLWLTKTYVMSDEYFRTWTSYENLSSFPNMSLHECQTMAGDAMALCGCPYLTRALERYIKDIAKRLSPNHIYMMMYCLDLVSDFYPDDMDGEYLYKMFKPDENGRCMGFMTPPSVREVYRLQEMDGGVDPSDYFDEDSLVAWQDNVRNITHVLHHAFGAIDQRSLVWEGSFFISQEMRDYWDPSDLLLHSEEYHLWVYDIYGIVVFQNVGTPIEWSYGAAAAGKIALRKSTKNKKNHRNFDMTGTPPREPVAPPRKPVAHTKYKLIL